MAFSTQREVSDGTLSTLILQIDYLDRSEITVYFDLVETTAWSWVGEVENKITFDDPVPNGVEVLVRRATDASKLRHSLAGGAAFLAAVLDENWKQALHIAQEAVEANITELDLFGPIHMHGNRITGLGNAVDPGDAVTYEQYLNHTASLVAAQAVRDELAALGGSALVGHTRENGSVTTLQAAVRENADRLQTFSNYAGLRAYTGPWTRFFVAGANTVGDGGAGMFRLAATDFTTPDDGGTVLVGGDGRRWKRVDLANANVNWFGAVGDGSTDCTAAVQAMAAVFGYAKFSNGVYKINTATFAFKLYFNAGAAITVPSGQTLTITRAVESPKQFIFRGSGDYVLGHDGNGGEETRYVHVSWFGAVTWPGVNPTDQAPFINKAFLSVGNARESVVEFDIGNYTLRSTVSVTRCGHVKGAGTRKTVFLHNTDGFDSFVTAGVGCKFSDIQFEIRTEYITTRNNAFITINHGECEVYDVNMGNTKLGVVINANSCRVRNILANWGSYPGADSSLVHIRSGSGSVVDGILANTSAYGPDFIVRLGGTGQSGTMSNITVRNVQHSAPAGSVGVLALLGAISRVSISNIRSNAFSGTVPPEAVLLRTASTFGLDDMTINDVLVNSYTPCGIRLQQDSSGVMQDVLISGVSVSGGTGSGIEFNRTLGTLRDIRVASDVSVEERSNPYVYAGASSNIVVAPAALPGVNSAFCYDMIIGDDSVHAIQLHRPVYTGVLVLTVGSSRYVQLLVRAAPSPTSVTMFTSANMATSPTALTGTSGADGNFTVGITNGVLYFENRLGSEQRVSATLMTGVK